MWEIVIKKQVCLIIGKLPLRLKTKLSLHVEDQIRQVEVNKHGLRTKVMLK